MELLPKRVIAEGDSWFDYPPRLLYPDDAAYEADRRDVLKWLKDRTVHNEPGGQPAYKVESVAAGDRLEDMAYGGPQSPQLAQLELRIGDQQCPKPTAVLLSGGGNDLVTVDGLDPKYQGPATAFGMLLNHARSAVVLAGQNELNESVVTGVIDQRLRDAYVTILRKVTEVSVRWHGQPVPILVHGYDYPVPDGRFTVLQGFSVGPILGPAFVAKGYGKVDLGLNPSAALTAEQREQLQVRMAVMKELIDRFNAMLQDVAALGEFAHVRYVDLRGTLSTELQANNNFYQKYWENELHPTAWGFREIADRFHQALQKLG